MLAVITFTYRLRKKGCHLEESIRQYHKERVKACGVSGIYQSIYIH